MAQPRPLTPEERLLAKEEEQAPVDAVRQSALGWTGTIGLLTTAAALAGTFGFKFDFSLQAGWAQTLVSILIFVATAGALVAIGFAAIAAQGWPKDGIHGDPLERARQRSEQSKTASEHLATSRFIAGIAVVSLLAILAISLWAPTEEPVWIYTMVDATPANSQAICGEVETIAGSGQLSLLPEGGADAITVTDFSKLAKQTTASCP